MKKRLDTLDNSIPQVDPVAQLAEIYKAFSKVFFIEYDIKNALKIRLSADPILEEFPEFRNSVPGRIGKNAFIEWDRFIAFPKTKHMKPDLKKHQ